MTGAWVEGADGSGFGIEHLPYGVVSTSRTPPRVAVRIGDHALDLEACARAGLLDGTIADPASVFSTDRLNRFLAHDASTWAAVRERVQELLAADATVRPPRDALQPLADVRMHLPVRVGDYVDFYSSLHHATNLGRMFRPDGDPLLPNWRHLPIAYHGRSGTVVVDGTPVTRPCGQRRPTRPGETPPFGPTERLDIELEVGFVTGDATVVGQPLPIGQAEAHIFGIVLVNDWSARDIQAWEYQPLGPFLGKSFATSIAAWVTPLPALEHVRVPPPQQDPQVAEYLRLAGDRGVDLSLRVGLRPAGVDETTVISRVSFADMYWTMAQQLAHATVNGASLRPGDLFASGTVSGPERGSEGSLIELTRAGAEPLDLPGGVTRTFLEDGDCVTLSGSAGPVTLAPVRGTIKPAPTPNG